MSRRRLVAALAGAAVVAAGVALLRSGVEPPAPPATSPEGEQIRAFHDAALIDPPPRPESDPGEPGALRVDPRQGGALITWPPAPYGFDVRWGRAGGPLDTVRYLTTPGMTLYGLEPGEYQVEVRAVDAVGRRSAPATARVTVTSEVPPWASGLDFLDDFTQGADLAPERWYLGDDMRRCLRRNGPREPVLLVGQCYTVLRPNGMVRLSEPGPGGVRGRVLVVADVPATRPEPQLVGESVVEDANELVIAVGQAFQLGGENVVLRVSVKGAFLSAGGADEVQQAARLDEGAAGYPGAMRRWELVFTDAEVRVLTDGEQVGAVPYRADWDEAQLSVTAQQPFDSGLNGGTRVAMVGYTGDRAADRPAESIVIRPASEEAGGRQVVRLPGRDTAEAAVFSALVIGLAEDGSPDAPEVVAEFGGRPLATTSDRTGHGTYWLRAALTAEQARAGGDLVLRSVDGTPFSAYEIELRVDHRRGTALRLAEVRSSEVHDTPTMPRARIVVRRDGRVVDPAERRVPGRLEFEVTVDSATAQGIGGSVVGWVALRVEFDGRPVLDLPTADDGPAVAGRYVFTLDTTSLGGISAGLQVMLVPDRRDVTPTVERVSVRVER
ncbi:MAG TPA: fibronectin type III domain-containing protein [Pseudonocardiaceae bacterium]